VIWGTPDSVASQIRRFSALGIEHFILRFVDFPSHAGLELFLEEVRPQFQP
jgi:alkanesulfonate monooxygenase SsuD/methylene tetrahydromethanopterin reductase-like flavin-dependent oxidoreductase (luciferase family)